LSQILSQASAPLTYVELVDRVHQQYVQWGRSFPTPSIEGGERDREVLGTKRWPGRSRITLSGDAPGGWRINAGALSGLTSGSVLRVHPPAGQADADAVLGHVRISALRVLDADVEAVALGNAPAPKSLPAGGRCDVVYRNYGTHPLRLAFEVSPAAAHDAAKVEELRKALKNLGGGEHPLFTWASEPRSADWVVRVDSEKAYLVPASGWAMRADAQRGDAAPAAALSPSPEFGPVDANAVALRPWLEERLNRIARVQNLLALAAPDGIAALDAESSVEIHLELVKFRDRADTQGEVIPWTSAGRRLRPGDLVGFRAWNRGRTAIDITFLFVDSGFGIKAMFPRRNTTGDNRVAPGQSVLGTRATVSATTVGMEHMVVIAVEAQSSQPPVDFGCLEQPTIEAIRTRGGEEPLDSPLGRLLKQALYAQGGTRGLDATDVSRHALRVISWQVVAQPRKDESK
jgi:hypothetical protein